MAWQIRTLTNPFSHLLQYLKITSYIYNKNSKFRLTHPTASIPIRNATPRCNDCKKCLYGTLFTPRLLTLHDASVYSSQRIGRPILPTRAKYIISHILSDLQKEEIRTYQKKTESVGGKNICSNLANENRRQTESRIKFT